MEPSNTTLNLYMVQKQHSYIDSTLTIFNEDQKIIIIFVNYVFMCNLISLLGLISNVINLVVFYKQGLDSSINITFFALAISDLCGPVFQLLLNVCVNPLFEKSDIFIVPSEFQYLTAAVPRVAFSKITCLITVYATMERCLCITFPLHVKRMITPKRTAIVMSAIYSIIFLSMAPLYCTNSIDWKFYPVRNKTLLGLVLARNSYKLQEIVYILQAFLGFISFGAVVIFTTILIRKLVQKNTWRQAAHMDQAKSDSMSNRDRKTITMVVLIASILILCYTPSFILFFVTFVEPEFSVVGRFTNIFISMWSFGCLFETLNSSVNIFTYLKMSTKYRDTFYEVFVQIRTGQIMSSRNH